jgi:hypothetical protein
MECIFLCWGNDENAATKNSITHETVIKLLQPLEGKNNCVYMYHYYIGVPLFRNVERMGIYATGTILTNRKGLDKTVTINKS